MKRRTLLGSAAMTLGGASVIGTGAFTSVEAERSISVDVAGDADAFLQLQPYCNTENDTQSGDEPLQSSDFVYETSAETIAIDLTEQISEQKGNGHIEGEGITDDSLWRFPNAFRITNQGTQPVCIDLQVQDNDGEVTLNSGGSAIVGDNERHFSEGDPAVVFYPGTNDTSGNLFNDDETDGLRLNTSESQCIGFNVRTFGFNPGEGAESDGGPFDEANLLITADAGGACRDEEATQPQPRFDASDCEDVIENINNGGSECDISSSGSDLPTPGNNDLNGNICHTNEGSINIDNNGRTIDGFLYVKGNETEIKIKKDVRGAVVINSSDSATLKINGSKTIFGDVCIRAVEEATVRSSGASAKVTGDIKIDADSADISGYDGEIGGETEENASLEI